MTQSRFGTRLQRGLLLLASSGVLLATTAGPCDSTTVRSAFLGSVQQFTTSIIGAFFQSLEEDNFTPVTVSSEPAARYLG